MNALCHSTAGRSRPPRLLRSPPPPLFSRRSESVSFSRKPLRQLPEMHRCCRWRVSCRPAEKPEKEETEEEGEGWEEVGKEELEKLEEEAMMGDDQGKEPMDYNRRAHIFYRSSEVFQDVKESSPGPDPS
ncbi:unnamed protein product [Victoria cruziana]